MHTQTTEKGDMVSLRRNDPDGLMLRSHSSLRIAALAFVLFGLVGAFFIAASPAEPIVEGMNRTLQYLVSPWMLATEAITVGFLVYGYVFVRSSPREAIDITTVDGLLRRQRLRFLLVLGLFALGLAGIGAGFALHLDREADRQALVQTHTIARLKAQQVEKWLYERSIDAELAGTSLRQFPLEQWSQNPEVRQIVGVMLAEILAGHPERIAVTLFGPDGRILINLGQETTIGDTIGRSIEDRKSRVTIVDTLLNGSTGLERGTSFVLPIRGAGVDAAVAILGITADPALGLLKEVSAWPLRSASGEVLLVRRQGEDVAFITPPRSLQSGAGRPGSTGPPISPKGMLAPEAFQGGDWAGEGKDSRGVDVVAATAPVRGIDWRVVAKIDHAEIRAGINRKIATLAAVIAGAILLAGFMVAMLWQGQRDGIQAYGKRQEAERAALAQHYARMTASVRDAVLLSDARGNIVDANDAAVKSYGYSIAELRAIHAKDLRATEEQGTFEQQWRPERGELGRIFQTVHRRKDGTTFPVEIANNTFEIDGATYYQAFVRDISYRKSLEEKLERLARVQKALFDAGSVLLRARTEDELCREMCRILVENGGYRLVNISVPNQDEGKTVRYLTIAGDDDGYLAGAQISWGLNPQGMGPTGTALRDGAIQVNQDFRTNAQMAPWREAALTRGLQSSVSLPLRVSGQIFGALTLYAAQPFAFDQDELAMLNRFSEDIVYGLEKLRADRNVKAG